MKFIIALDSQKIGGFASEFQIPIFQGCAGTYRDVMRDVTFW